MKIPKRFRLYGQVISVVWDKDLRNEADATGHAVFRNNKVIIQKSLKGCPRTREQLEQTFLHELTHWILYSMSEKWDEKEGWMHQDESHITKFAGLLHQALTTMEYKK